MKLVRLPLLYILIMNPLQAADSITEKLRITTTLDIREIYTQSIKKVAITPSSLTLNLNGSHTGFNEENLNLVVETDIPTHISSTLFAMPYKIMLFENDATCNFKGGSITDFSASQITNPTFVKVSLDSTELKGVDVNTAEMKYSDFNSSYIDVTTGVEMKSSKHDINLEFVELDEIKSKMPSQLVSNCEGSLSFRIGTDI